MQSFQNPNLESKHPDHPDFSLTQGGHGNLSPESRPAQREDTKPTNPQEGQFFETKPKSSSGRSLQALKSSSRATTPKAKQIKLSTIKSATPTKSNEEQIKELFKEFETLRKKVKSPGTLSKMESLLVKIRNLSF